MTTRPETLGQDLKAWAADVLQVAPGAAASEVRAAYLRQIEVERGVPNLAAREALLILTGRTNAARPMLALEGAEEKLRRDVDDFAGRFFSLAITERKEEWERLHARGQGFPRVDARLAALRPGLYIVMPHLDRQSHLGQLARVVCELFVLRPIERAAHRQACLSVGRTERDGVAWTRAATLLRKNHPSIAALAPELIASLAEAEAQAEERHQLGRKMQKVAVPAETAGTNSRWRWLVAVAVALAMMRAIGAGTSCNSNSRQAPKPASIQSSNKIDFDELLKKNKIELWKDGVQWRWKGLPNLKREAEGNVDRPDATAKDK